MSYKKERAIAEAALNQPWDTEPSNRFNAMATPQFVLRLMDRAADADRFEVHAKALDDLAKAQAQDGNWNYDAYMHGMANGLILARNCIRSGGSEEPVFLDAPAVWLADIPTTLNPKEANDEAEWVAENETLIALSNAAAEAMEANNE